MKNFKIFKILLVCILALAAGSCDEKEETDSVVTRFATYPVELETGALVVPEFDRTHVLDLKTNDSQIQDLVVHVEVSKKSTATEGEDFELVTHEIELPAFGGQDGFPVELIIHDDQNLNEGDEEIYLTFTSDVPSGLESKEVLVATIKGCTALSEGLFVGDYQLSATNSQGTAVKAFEDQTVTLEAPGGSSRAFSAIYLEGFGITTAQDLILNFDACNGTVFMVEHDTGLACSSNIILSPGSPNQTFNSGDDSQFTIIFIENELDPTASSGCGYDGTAPVTLTFTKVE